MIGKMTKGSSASGLINYLLQPKQNAVILGANGVSTVTKQGVVNGFNMHIQELGREDVKHPIGHVALSWSPDDRGMLNDKLMLEVAMKYMREMGMYNAPYVVVRHNCTDHPHLHIAYSRVDCDGKVLKSSNDFRRNAKVCKQLSAWYGFKMGSKRGKRYSNNLKGADAWRQRLLNCASRACDSTYDWRSFSHRLATRGISISFRMNRQKNAIAGVVFTDDLMSVPGSKLADTLSFHSIDDLFGGELQQATLNASAALSKGFILAFDTAMQLIAQPNVAQTTGVGGGSSNELETEDDKKRKRLEAEAAQARHLQQMQEQPAHRRRGRR